MCHSLWRFLGQLASYLAPPIQHAHGIQSLLTSFAPPAGARVATGTIAHVRDDTGDEIRLIEPDGSNDRLL